MAVDTSLGGVPRLTSRRFANDRQRRQDQRPNYDRFFRPGSAIRPEEKKGIVQRQAASIEQDKLNAQRDAVEQRLAIAERVAEANQEGDIAFGKLGDNEPGDTRMASVLKALGVAPDFMSAIIASAQVPKAHRKPR